MVKWHDTATIINQPYLLPIHTTKHLADFPQQKFTDVLACINYCQNQLNMNKLDILVLDQSRKEVDLKIVKVIVPGLRHFWRRLALGRLYDVPVKLNWLSKALDEEQLNPISMFL
jgi:ribosomal protein S12 methylthiotransferase accessory factor